MSTVQFHALELEERNALVDLVSVTHRVASILRRQVAEKQREAELYDKSARISEDACERLCERLSDITGRKISTYSDAVDLALNEINRLMSDSTERLGKYAKLVRLCLDAKRLSAGIIDASDARQICEAVDDLKNEEMPF